VRSASREKRSDLVLIGHVGFATDRTVNGTFSYIGGSGFATASAASALLDDGLGLVTQVGDDFDMDSLRRFGLDTEGVTVLPGASATFVIDQFPDGSRSFRSDLGVAAEPSFEEFPPSFFQARYVHLGTAPPGQQLAWLDFLRDKGCRAQVSVDMFESFVATERDACRRVCDRADLIFLNDVEYRGLYGGEPQPRTPTILKHGPGGAEFLGSGRSVLQIPACPATEVDPIGAGEILAGVFLALRVRGLPQDRALTCAVAAASSSVTEFGVTGAGLTRELRRIKDEVDSGARRLTASAQESVFNGRHSPRVVPGSSRATGTPLGAAATDIILVIRPSPASFRIASWMA
jgi:sugar/nucleoside kinase (ribokinase family)